MAEVIGPPQVGKHPVVVKVIAINNEADGSRLIEEVLQAKIDDFFTRWKGTHIVSAPSYILGNDGTERVFLQAVDRVLWLQQNEEQGIAQARLQFAGGAEMQRLQGGQIALVSGGAMPPAPTPGEPRRKVIEGGFGR